MKVSLIFCRSYYYPILQIVSFLNNPFIGPEKFLIVWIIGYEVIAVISLLWILKLFITFDNVKKVLLFT